ncbi:hypothetical protein [uncultured Rubinisphaera sp.]|uniref:hypothetical protein n=1 Tax=uncultured Rubinisphaera sp. TaxID=1678686 RepID=UPI0030DA3723
MAIHKSSVSLSHQKLIELMQHIHYGRIERLVINDCHPELNPPPEITREIKLGGQFVSRSEPATEDFALKSQILELFTYFDQLQDGVIEVLEIKHGLPFRMIVRETAA